MALDFTAIDFETANSYRGSPCSVGLAKVRDGRVVDERRWLMRPPAEVDYFDAFNTYIHGITPQMVAREPRWKDRLPQILDFMGDDVLVAHNAGFDIGVMRYACAVDNIEWPGLRFLCTMVMSRRVLPLPSYRLPFVAEYLGVPVFDHHEALADARAVVDIVNGLAVHQGVADLDALATKVGVVIGRMWSGAYKGSVSTASASSPVRHDVNADADPDGYLYGRNVVFTGALMSMTRQIAWDECSRIGAIAEHDVTKRTNVLVIGDINPAVLRPGSEWTGKARKAFDLQAKGQQIEVMTEDDFLRCIDPATSASFGAQRRPAVPTVQVPGSEETTTPLAFVENTEAHGSMVTVERTSERAAVPAVPQLVNVEHVVLPPPMVELVCERCGRTWLRPSQRGRRPRRCRNCS